MATGYDPNDPNRLDRDGDGRVDARDGVHGDVRRDHPVAAVDPGLTKEVRRDAYERGRADERSRHKRNPLLTVLIALAAVFGLAVIGLYIYNGGSFTETGRDLDAATQRATTEAAEVGREVVDETGEGLQDVGRRVEREGEAAQQSEPATRSTPAPTAAPAEAR